MQYDRAQRTIEEFVQNSWDATALQFDNVPFNSDLYREYVRCTVLFGEGYSRSVVAGCYRQTGLLLTTVYGKPGEGSARILELSSTLAELLTSKVAKSSDLPSLAVNIKVPDFFRDLSGKSGWVFVQLSFPFYYDLEIP